MEIQQVLQKNARRMTYAAAFLLACATLFLYPKSMGANGDVVRAFGYLSFTFMSLSLAVSPIRALFPAFKYNAALYMARRALGVSAFVFASLHYAINSLAFYKGDPLYFAPSLGDAGTLIGVASLAMLFPLAATSFDFAVRKMGQSWFMLHKLAYLAYPAIIAHAYLAGSDFGGMNAYSGSFLLIASATLLLEAARLWRALRAKAGKPPAAGQAQG